MNHPIRQQRWLSYSVALLMIIALSWGLTQPALAAPVNTAIQVISITPFNPSPITGVSVAFEVSSDGGTVPLTGVVTITASGGGKCTTTLTAGNNHLDNGYTASALCFLSPPVGVHTLTLTYSGDSNYSSSTLLGVQVTVKFRIDIAITAHTPDPSSVDQTVLVQYSLTPERPGLPNAPTGTVSVSDGVNSCLAPLAAGQCSLILETAGTRTLTASYSGDSNFHDDSASVNHTVISYASTTRITADTPDPSVQGQAVTVGYSVVANDPSKGTPSGNVTVSDGVDSCTGTVAAGSCSLTLSTSGARTLTATYAGNTKFAGSTSAGELHTVNVPDTTLPTITASGRKADGTPYTTGTWTNQNVTVHFSCSDAGSGIAFCPGDQVISPDGTFTAQGTARDNAGNTASVSFGPIKIDKTAPSVLVTGVTNGATYPFGSVPSAACSTTDALSGVATQATRSVTGGNPDGSGTFTATCSGATDLAGNGAAAVSVSYTVNAPTPTPTDTPLPTATPTATATDTPLPTATPTATATDTPLPTATPTNTPVPPTATPTPTADACLTPGLLDNFNRANGGLGGNWNGLTDQSFYKLTNNKVDVQLGGAVVWKPTIFGPNQAAFVTLSTLDALSPAQGLLLKVQTGSIPNAGAIAVVYDSLAKAVRVSTLRLNTPAWTPYPNTVVTFANGDKLGGCVKADGTVRVYKNNTLLATVTLNAADQSFFNVKGGKLGLWTILAPNAFFDDFGGGALDGVSAADTTDESANPDRNAQTNLIFLPVVSR